jgi:hypothetical protein
MFLRITGACPQNCMVSQPRRPVVQLRHDSMKKNKKFWKQLITYLLLIWHGPHSKRCVQQFFYCCMCVTMGTYLLSYCLTTISRHTYTYTYTHTHTHTHREGGLTEELLEAVFSLWPDPKLHKEDNFLLRTVVGSQSYAETQKLKDFIIKTFPQQWPSLWHFSGCTIFRCHEHTTFHFSQAVSSQQLSHSNSF